MKVRLMKKKATLYDLSRFCKHNSCSKCPLKAITMEEKCTVYWTTNIEKLSKINETILKWCEQNPQKTRQDVFLKKFPQAEIGNNGALELCPKCIYGNTKEINCQINILGTTACFYCKKKFWLQEVKSEVETTNECK